MKRRSFLAMFGLAPAVAAPSEAAASQGHTYVRVPVSKLAPETILEFKDGKVTLSCARLSLYDPRNDPSIRPLA